MADLRYVHTKDWQETVSDTSAPASNSNTLMGLLGGLANRIKAITGKGSWTDSPDATLADAASHHDRTDNPHAVTRGQIGAAAATALSSHTADQSNPHAVTAAQAGARPATWVPGWNDVTGKPVSFPSSWNEIAGKPSTYPTTWTGVSGKPSAFAPSAHKATHASGGADALSAADVAAAPASHTTSRTDHPAATATEDGRMTASYAAKLDGLLGGATNFRANQGSAGERQSLAAGTYTKMLFPTEVRDAQGEYDPATSILTPKKAQLLLVGSSVLWDSAQPDGNRTILQIYKNGVEAAHIADGSTGAAGASASVGPAAPVVVAAGDKLEVYSWSANALSTNHFGGRTYFYAIGVALA